uniref:Uncharacterized protein n=1 Tax=Lotharella oceanica TaxID=641309 RepID=A0A7S2U1A7_9EUKA|mmetsp:Transcript_37550/g.69217  ORF Transcript_37550/g.69217 Transcript_37550/m.69217 type:complete len:168 (+) Transcript_37550:57-560(+)|eukprot:CAMPEP_0170169758 /NCGR_PEP_ID=MMETSP0040_2-20121228/2701_1 /TAXON_ID=641309 /ORGANISM="Lotharella oceanica, Strain CCMP622" /LENGTH=167 /DNA_ID=CAMNT_0010408707 /DNA_START=30 /DNA_END=533 /DNA_ORIENTATION=-
MGATSEDVERELTEIKTEKDALIPKGGERMHVPGTIAWHLNLVMLMANMPMALVWWPDIAQSINYIAFQDASLVDDPVLTSVFQFYAPFVVGSIGLHYLLLRLNQGKAYQIVSPIFIIQAVVVCCAYYFVVTTVNFWHPGYDVLAVVYSVGYALLGVSSCFAGCCCC